MSGEIELPKLVPIIGAPVELIRVSGYVDLVERVVRVVLMRDRKARRICKLVCAPLDVVSRRSLVSGATMQTDALRRNPTEVCIRVGLRIQHRVAGVLLRDASRRPLPQGVIDPSRRALELNALRGATEG